MADVKIIRYALARAKTNTQYLQKYTRMADTLIYGASITSPNSNSTRIFATNQNA